MLYIPIVQHCCMFLGVSRRPSQPDAERLRSSVGTFVRRMRASDGMPSGHPAVLAQLVAGGDLSITELAARASVKHQSMARTVKLLAEQGLVEVSVDPADRRRAVVHVTPTGTERLRVERALRASRIAAAAHATLDDEEREILARIPAILDKLSAYEG